MKMRRLLLWAAALAPSAAVAQSQPGGSSETGTLINRRAAQIQGESRADARLTSKRFGERSIVRSSIAEAMYRLSTVARVQGKLGS